MRSGLRYTAAWLLATTLAVCVSWIGVRGAVRSAVFGDGPAPPPVSGVEPTASSSRTPGSTRPARPGPGRTGSPDPTTSPRATRSPTRTSRPSPGPTPTEPSSPKPSEPAGVRRTVRVEHGTAVVRLTSQNARVLTATPSPGYTEKVWYDDGWLRVDFARGQHGSAVFVTWNDHPPLVQTYEY